MRTSFHHLLILFIALPLIFSGCKNSSEPEPSQDALILEFSIQELPHTTFEVDHEMGIISAVNPGSISEAIDSTSLTPVFETSEGATVILVDSTQTSGETDTNFSRVFSIPLSQKTS